LNWSGNQGVMTPYAHLRLNANKIFYSKMYEKILIRKSIEKKKNSVLAHSNIARILLIMCVQLNHPSTSIAVCPLINV
jgi:hypothetical protein